jgi:heme exporter protein A
MSTPAIEARQLTRRLGPSWALRGVDLVLPQGRSLLLFGANGAGKTTLVRVLATALRPTGGTLTLFGAPPSQDVRPRLGLLSHADGHYDALSARENLAIAADLGPTQRGIDDVLAQTGLAARAADLVGTFSAGMRKRLAFARLLMKDPEIVLLDEPYAQLDPRGHTFVDDLLADLRARGRTVVVSTHMVERVAPFCDDAVRLDAGRVTWLGPAADAPDA